MKILYIFPHPDDESYGVAHVMNKQLREGHEVYLLTLTKGGATKLRHKFNYTIEQMGEVRFNEMKDVARYLGLTAMNVLNLPDSGLKELDPRVIEKVIEEEIRKVKPEVIVSYAVHGISGFHDHIIAHSVVKRVFVNLKEKTNYLKRYAMLTLSEEDAAKVTFFKVHGSKPDEIDCIITVSEEDIEAAKGSLDYYKTYKETIENSGIKEHLSRFVYFELFMEKFDPPINDLFAGL